MPLVNSQIDSNNCRTENAGQGSEDLVLAELELLTFLVFLGSGPCLKAFKYG